MKENEVISRWNCSCHRYFYSVYILGLSPSKTSFSLKVFLFLFYIFSRFKQNLRVLKIDFDVIGGTITKILFECA